MKLVTLPEYAGKQNLDRFLTQMESLLKSSAVPVKFWLTYLKQQCQKDSRAYDALLEAEKKYSKTFDPVKASDDEHYIHFTNCIALLKEKRGIPRDQQIRDLLSQYYTIKQAQRESVADFSHRFSEVQNELEKLIPGIHRTADGELELIHAFSIKLLPEISKEIVSREFKYTTLQEIITVASRYEQNVLFSGSKEPHSGNSQPGVMYSQPHFEGPRRTDPVTHSLSSTNGKSGGRTKPQGTYRNYKGQGQINTGNNYVKSRDAGSSNSKQICFKYNKHLRPDCLLENGLCRFGRQHKCSDCGRVTCKALHHKSKETSVQTNVVYSNNSDSSIDTKLNQIFEYV